VDAEGGRRLVEAPVADSAVSGLGLAVAAVAQGDR
jgi:hypothetical protein